MGQHHSKTSGQNHTQISLQQPFQNLLTAYATSLTKREKRLILFVIYYLEWLELPSVDNEALHSRYRAYRAEMRNTINDPSQKQMAPGQYQKKLEKDINNIKNMLKCGNKSGDLKILFPLLKAVEEAFRFGNMPPRFGQRCEEEEDLSALLLDKNMFDSDVSAFDEKNSAATADIVQRPPQMYRPGKEVSATISWEIPLSQLQPNNSKEEQDIKLTLPMGKYYIKKSDKFWNQKRTMESLDVMCNEGYSRANVERMVKERLEHLEGEIQYLTKQKRDLVGVQTKLRGLC